MLSVIIPLYNKEPYIEKSISSLAMQSCKEFEVIVIDDGSTDYSYEVAKVALAKSGLDYRLLKQQNCGVSNTRNRGVELAKYNYIAFLDADDWWAANFVEEMSSFALQNSDGGIYASGYYIVKNGQNRVAPIGVESGFVSGEIEYFKVYSRTLCMPLHPITVVIPKEIFLKKGGFNPKIKFGEDFDLFVRIGAEERIYLLNKPLAFYNQDVEIKNRAVGSRMYKPEESMLFTNYGELMKNSDFNFLYQQLALYSLLPYYLSKSYESEVNRVLEIVDWSRHSIKQRLYYKVLPRAATKCWITFLKFGSKVKQNIKRHKRK